MYYEHVTTVSKLLYQCFAAAGTWGLVTFSGTQSFSTAGSRVSINSLGSLLVCTKEVVFFFFFWAGTFWAGPAALEDYPWLGVGQQGSCQGCISSIAEHLTVKIEITSVLNQR